MTDAPAALRAAVRRLFAAVARDEVEVRVLRRDLEVLLAVHAHRVAPVMPVMHPAQQ